MPQLTFDSCKKILRTHGISITPSPKVTSVKELPLLLKKTPFPLVIKAYSPSLLHKSHEGMVYTNIIDEHTLIEKYNSLKKRLLRHGILDGSIILQHQLQGDEFIIGAKKDETFGPIVLIGLGGVHTELFKKTSIRICPLSKTQAQGMAREIAGSLIDPQKLPELCSLLLKVGKLIEQETIKEMDLNPVIINKSGVYVVDARMAT
jgi:succinyl-CoA synthetase beta subunit